MKKQPSLVEQAKLVKRRSDKITPEEIELALAWANDEITLTQCSTVMKHKSPTTVYAKLAIGLKQYIQRQK